MPRLQHLAAVLLSLLILAGNGALCAGWAPTPEARMECCKDERKCPMHAGDRDERSRTSLTQSQADACCASSQPEPADQSSQAPSAGPAVLDGTTVVPSSLVMVVPQVEGWRSPPPIPIAAVPRHVLFSVFLV